MYCANLMHDKGSALHLWDQRHDLTVYGTPKGGATAATQIMFRLMGLYKEALAYSPWIHDYRVQVHNRRPERKILPTTRTRVASCAQCTEKGRCLKLIRNPMDRAVSGFLHYGRILKERRPEHGKSVHPRRHLSGQPFTYVRWSSLTSNKTFAQWVSMFKTAKGPTPFMKDHWLPQFVKACDSPTATNPRVVTHLPVEMLGHGLEVFANTYGIIGLHDPKLFNISSRHYVKPTKRTLPNAAHVPYEKLKTAIPTYSSFFMDSDIARDVCCIFAADVHMYRAACREPWVSACENCAATCKRELSRLQVCGDLAFADKMK